MRFSTVAVTMSMIAWLSIKMLQVGGRNVSWRARAIESFPMPGKPFRRRMQGGGLTAYDILGDWWVKKIGVTIVGRST